MKNIHSGNGGPASPNAGVNAGHPSGVTTQAQPLRVFVESQISNGGRKWRMTAGLFLEVLLLAGVLALPLFLTETMDSRVKTTPEVITIFAPPKGNPDADPVRDRNGNPNALFDNTQRTRKPRFQQASSQMLVDPSDMNRAIPEDSGEWNPGVVTGDLRWGVPGGTGNPGQGFVPGIPGIGTAPPPPVGPVRIGGIIKPPRLVRQVRPSYPPIARAGRIQGDVVLEAVLDANGRVRQLKVVDGHPLLAQSALRAVQQWVYEPTYLNGHPVAISMQITVKFRLGR